ncbi:MAG: alpha/beta hydrolase, partial [Pseudomonadota bacterium]
TVSAETLPGHKGGLAQYYTTMSNYTNSVMAQMPSAGEVVLVGHSMGGFVASRVAARKSSRIAKVIYISAMLPGQSQSILKLMKTFGSSLNDVEREFKRAGLSRKGPYLGTQPLLPLSVPFASNSGFRNVPKHYIHCDDDKIIPLAQQEEMVASAKGAPVTTSTLSSHHFPQVAVPDDLAAAVLAAMP